MSKKFGNISFKDEDFAKLSKEILNNDFECIDRGAEIFYVSKRLYLHEFDNPFNYRYVIKVTDGYEFDCTQNGIDYFYFEIYLVPLTEVTLNKVNKYCECEYIAEDTTSIDVAADAADCGCAIIMSRDTITYETDNTSARVDAERAAQEKQLIAAHCIDTIDSLRGFYFDAPQNLIGTTGWDVIEECLGGEDAINASVNRLMAERENR